MHSSDMHARLGKLAMWWRRWCKRDAAADLAACCGSHAAELSARAAVANGPKPQVFAGRWPVDPGLQRVGQIWSVDRT